MQEKKDQPGQSETGKNWPPEEHGKSRGDIGKKGGSGDVGREGDKTGSQPEKKL